MPGLLFSAALAGLATIAWPVYLHVRKRRDRRVQVVPSLRLFGFTSRRARRLRLRQPTSVSHTLDASAVLVSCASGE